MAIIWASTREVFNVIGADAMGCHIITAPADVLKKMPAIGTQPRRTVAIALAAGLTLEIPGKMHAAA